MPRKHNEKCIFLSPVDYYALSQRHQAISTRLAKKGIHVYYVNPIKSCGLSIYKKPLNPSLEIIDVSVPYRSYSRPFFQKLMSKITVKLLKKAIEFDIEKSLLWIADPGLSEITNGNWSTIVYDRCDLHGSFPGQSNISWAVHEKIIFNNSDMIFISHPFLQKDIPISNNTKLLPNALDEKWLSLSKIPKPALRPIKLLSSGAHFEWIDFDWLELLTKIPNIELNIAGPGRGLHFNNLISQKNVIYHGTVSHNQLQDLMLTCHVGLIPFKDIELTKAVDPIKAYEYAACGLEIWGTDISSIKVNPLIARTIKNNSNALMAVEALISANAFSNKHTANTMPTNLPTWNERIKTILDSFTEID